MKKLITVLCLMIAVAGAGQHDTRWITKRSGDSLTSKTDGKFIFNTTITSGRNSYDTPCLTPKYDTIPIIYLYCNTAVAPLPRTAYWDFGYEVREETGLMPVTSRENNMLFDWVMSYKFVGYLDRQKNPIHKSMIIWQTKTIDNGTN